MLLITLLLLTVPFAPVMPDGTLGFNDISIPLKGLSFGQRILVLLAMEAIILLAVLLMHHTRRVFEHFARGEIFALPVIGHIRRAGLWLIVSFFANIAGQIALRAANLVPREQAHGTAWPLVIGVVTCIAAYVMEEGRRIAADHAEII